MIGLGRELPENNEMYELHRLLGALLSQELTADEKLKVIGTEYDIPVEDKFREDVSVMCNLSKGIEEKGIAIGEERGIRLGEERGIRLGEERGIRLGEEQGILSSIRKLMSNLKMNLEQALDTLEISEEEKPKYREMINNASNK